MWVSLTDDGVGQSDLSWATKGKKKLKAVSIYLYGRLEFVVNKKEHRLTTYDKEVITEMKTNTGDLANTKNCKKKKSLN